MAGDLATMKSRVASELSRADLTTQIASAISDAIAIYQKERFRFSDAIPSAPPTFNTILNQWIYTTSDNANISTLFDFDYVIAQVGVTLSTLIRDTPSNIRIANQLGALHGQPMSYSYEGNELLISPVPDASYPITLGIFQRVAAPASDGEAGNPWMIDAERLIRCRAKFEIATHITRNPTMAAAMSPDPGQMPVGATYREWKSLKAEANKVTSRGRITAMAF
jgi:hypothetical protein